MRLEISWLWTLIATLIALLCAASGLWMRKVAFPDHLRYSHLAPLLTSRKSLRVRLAALPTVLKWMALGLLLVALARPQLLVDELLPRERSRDDATEISQEEHLEELPLPTEGVALYFVLDRSGSMTQDMAWVASDGQRRQLRRLDILKEITRKFIAGDPKRQLPGRSNDLVGLVGFARVAHVMSPLTLDHKTVLAELENLSPVLYREADGTAIGYALFKTANLIAATRHFAEEIVEEGRPSYDIQSTAIILVTDGLHSPSPLDKNHTLRCMSVSEAARHAGENDIRVYIINVEPAVRYPQFASQRAELQKAADITGGRFYIADDPDSLLGIYAEIDQLERVRLPQERTYHAKVRERVVEFAPDRRTHIIELYPYFVGGGVVLLLVARLLAATWLRRTL